VLVSSIVKLTKNANHIDNTTEIEIKLVEMGIYQLRWRSELWKI